MQALASWGIALVLSLGVFAAPSGLARGQVGDAQTEVILVTVTNKTDDVNGDTSAADALQANPGPDGISLREAIQATNNDPGYYAIGFDPALDGKAIVALTRMETLGGGNVTIDGDVDGDGKADVTIRNDVPSDSPYVLEITSGGNRLQALILKGAFSGVSINAAHFGASQPNGQTFAGNILKQLVIKNARFSGIHLGGAGASPGCESNACATHNTWTNTKIAGNTIESRGNAIEISLGSVIGDHVDGIEIKGNKIRLDRDACEPGFGVNLSSGEGGRGTADNRITDVLVIKNVITGHAQAGVRVVAGSGDGDGNRIVGARIVGNRVKIGAARRVECMRMGVFVATGDGAEPGGKRYPEDNLIRDVEIKRNVLRKGAGVRLMAGCCGARRNFIHDVRIEDNTIDVVGFGFPGVGIHANWEGGRNRATESNRISDITVDANRISISRVGNDLYPDGLGGIAIGGGHYTGGTDLRDGTVKDVRIIDNRIDTTLIGINVVGGWGKSPGEAIANIVKRLVIAGNRVLHPPVAAVRYNDAYTKGINLLGGGLDAHRNKVICVRIKNNLIAGIRNAVSVQANYSSPGYAVATGNVARRTC